MNPSKGEMKTVFFWVPESFLEEGNGQEKGGGGTRGGEEEGISKGLGGMVIHSRVGAPREMPLFENRAEEGPEKAGRRKGVWSGCIPLLHQPWAQSLRTQPPRAK